MTSLEVGRVSGHYFWPCKSCKDTMGHALTSYRKRNGELTVYAERCNSCGSAPPLQTKSFVEVPEE